MPKIGANFLFESTTPNFERDLFETKEKMKACTICDEGHLSFCLEDNLRYEYRSTNTLDDSTGYWRLYDKVDKEVTWTDDSTLNNYQTDGVFHISGTRKQGATTTTDGLPFDNNDEYATFDCMLTVTVAPEITTTSGNKWGMIGQTITFLNRTGAELKVYTRTCKVTNSVLETWTDWINLQGNKYVGKTTCANLSNLIDNGLYSGVLTDSSSPLVQGMVFVMTTINNYVVADLYSAPHSIMLVLFAQGMNAGTSIDITGKVYTRTLLMYQGNIIATGSWKEPCQNAQETADKAITDINTEVTNRKSAIASLKSEMDEVHAALDENIEEITPLVVEMSGTIPSGESSCEATINNGVTYAQIKEAFEANRLVLLKAEVSYVSTGTRSHQITDLYMDGNMLMARTYFNSAYNLVVGIQNGAAGYQLENK